ncbi:MAG: hypothetical protein AB7M12_10685 [Hyphomonadaceae bacterium]
MAEAPLLEAKSPNGASRLLRWVGAGAIALAGVVIMAALTLVAAAAAVIGVTAGAIVLLAYRVLGAPRFRRAGVDLLEARRTPDGWVVEGARSR